MAAPSGVGRPTEGHEDVFAAELKRAEVNLRRALLTLPIDDVAVEHAQLYLAKLKRTRAQVVGNVKERAQTEEELARAMVKLAQAGVERAQAEVKQAEDNRAPEAEVAQLRLRHTRANKERAQAEEELARAMVKQAEYHWAPGAEVAQLQLRHTRAKEERAQAEEELAQAEVKLAQAGVKRAQAEVEVVQQKLEAVGARIFGIAMKSTESTTEQEQNELAALQRHEQALIQAKSSAEDALHKAQDVYKKLLEAASTSAQTGAFASLSLAEAPPFAVHQGAVDKLPWVENKVAAEFARDILERDFEAVRVDISSSDDTEMKAAGVGAAALPDGGVHVLQLSTPWVVFKPQLKHVVVRSCAREVYEKMWKHAQKLLAERQREHRLTMVLGNPGIGKSANLTYLLRILLKDGRLVVFWASAVQTVFMFVPVSGKPSRYTCYSCPIAKFISVECAALHQPDTIMIHDPPNSAARDTDVQVAYPANSVLIIASSPNDKRIHHFTGLKFYLPTWSVDDMVAAAPYMDAGWEQCKRDELEKLVMKRHHNLGGTWRYAMTLDEALVAQYLQVQEWEVDDLDEHRLQAALSDVTSVVKADSMPSFLFQVLPGGNVSFLSVRALLLAARKLASNVAMHLACLQPSDATAAGWMFEALALLIIQRKPQLVGADESVKQLERVDADPTAVIDETGIKPGQLVVPTVRGYPAVDAVARLDARTVVAFQVTISESHPVPAWKIAEIGLKLAIQSGAATPTSDSGRALKVTPAKFELCFVVPWYRDKFAADQKYDGPVSGHQNWQSGPPNGFSDFVTQRVVHLGKDDFIAGIKSDDHWARIAEHVQRPASSRKRPRRK